MTATFEITYEPEKKSYKAKVYFDKLTTLRSSNYPILDKNIFDKFHTHKVANLKLFYPEENLLKIINHLSYKHIVIVSPKITVPITKCEKVEIYYRDDLSTLGDYLMQYNKSHIDSLDIYLSTFNTNLLPQILNILEAFYDLLHFSQNVVQKTKEYFNRINSKIGKNNVQLGINFMSSKIILGISTDIIAIDF